MDCSERAQEENTKITTNFIIKGLQIEIIMNLISVILIKNKQIP